MSLAVYSAMVAGALIGIYCGDSFAKHGWNGGARIYMPAPLTQTGQQF